jgi:DNA-binding MarR family transcriptional regulator/N-acetylglutamate synthase-like GNAT family acetyltransferase
MSLDEVRQIRTFNRTVTERIGALDEHYLARGRPLGASRVLWEIGPDGTDVRTLRARLALDSGYLSRLLRSLERDRLVTVDPLEADRRVRIARRTPAGDAEAAELDRLSDDLARGLLEPLDDRQRARLLDAAVTIERLLRAGMVEIAAADPTTDEARFCVGSYFAELDRRMDGGFDASLSRYGDIAEFVEPAGMLLLARLRGEPVGCGALRFGESGVTEIKRMWLSNEVRGLGLGRRLLGELERHARDHGARLVRLDTNHVLTEAIALYDSAGYARIEAFNDERYADHWFEKQLD